MQESYQNCININVFVSGIRYKYSKQAILLIQNKSKLKCCQFPYCLSNVLSMIRLFSFFNKILYLNSYSRAKVAQFSSSDGHRTPSRNMSLYDLKHLLILIIVGIFRSPFNVRFPDLMSLHVMVIFFENIEMLWLKQLV